MPDGTKSLGRIVARELAAAVGTWLAVATGLYVVYRLYVGRVASELGRRASEGSGPGLLEWVVGYTTLDYGTATMYRTPVSELLFEGLGTLLPVALAVAVVGVALAAAVAALVVATEDTPYGDAVAAVATALGSLPPVVGLFVVVMLALAVEPLPLTLKGRRSIVGPLVTSVLAGVAVTLPLAGQFAGRVRSWRARGTASGWGPRGRLLRAASHEALLYVAYLAGTMVLVDYLFAVGGLGTLYQQAVMAGDAASAFGFTGFVALVLVVLRGLRNVAVAVIDREAGADGPDERAVGTDGGSATRVDVGDALATLADAVVDQHRALTGAVGLGVVLLVGLVGSAVVRPVTLAAIGDGVPGGFPASAVVHTFGSLGVVLLVALVVALPVGVPVGLAAARLDGRGVALRAAADGWLVVPPLLLVVALLFGTGTWQSRTAYEMVVGVVGGLFLAAHAVVLLRGAAHGAGRLDGDAVARAVGRTVAAVPLAGFVLADLGAATLVGSPSTALAATSMVQLAAGLEGAGPLAVLGAAATLVVSLGVPSLCVLLLGDGIAAAAE